MSEPAGRQVARIPDDLANIFLSKLENYFPLLLGLGIGISIVLVFGSLPGKWVVFIVSGTVALSIVLLVATLTSKTREMLLFSSIPTLPLFYSITIQYRENVKFSVLANGFPIDLFDIGFLTLLLMWVYQLWTKPGTVSIYFPRNWTLQMALMLGINLYSAFFIARENFFSFSMVYGQLKCYLIAFFVANYIRDRDSLRLVGYAFAAILLTQGLIVIEQLFVGVVFTEQNLGRATSLKSVADLSTIYRVAGTLGHPNAMAMYLDLIIPWVGFQLLSEKHLNKKLYLGAALLLAIFAVLSSGSRGGWIGLALGGGVSTLFWYRKQGKNPVVALFTLTMVVSLIFGVLFASSNTFRTRLVAGDAGAAEVRLPLMEVAKEIISSNPIAGVGLANYTREMSNYDRTNLVITSFYNQPVHNTFLLMAAETGVPSLVVFLIFMLGALLMAYRLAKDGKDEIATLGFGLLAALIGWLVHNLVNQAAPFSDSTFWFLLGLLLAGQNQMIRERGTVQIVSGASVIYQK